MLIDIITQSNSTEVPGRPSPAELKAMALRQQQQIDSQHQLLAAKEQRLRFLKAQEVRGAAAAAEGERLRRLRERVEAQESKLRRLRALRGQVDLQKTYNVTLSNDLDSIRALFSEKEKELSVAVAKVEALTRQLEELRRDRRGPFNLIQGHGCQQLPNPAARELEKLRRELMYRNQLSLQQDARLHLQREALQQRQAELRSVDQRILELQTRLQRKKASNLILQSQQQQQQQTQQSPQISPSVLNTNQKHSQENQNPEKQHQQQQQQSRSSNIPLNGSRPSNNVYPSQRIVSRGNVAAVEPYIHTPQKSQQLKPQNKHAAATANTNQQNQLIQDFTNLKLNSNLGYNGGTNHISVNHLTYGESDESKLARQKLIVKSVLKTHSPTSKESDDSDAKLSSQKQEPPKTLLSYSSKIPKATTIPKADEKEEEKPILKQKSSIHIPSGNLVVPPRKPISSVAPTSVTSSIPKIVAQSPKVNKVAPNIVGFSESDKVRPALPPKPSKTSPTISDIHSAIPTVVSVINKAPISEPESSSSSPTASQSNSYPPTTDNLPIKAKPLTIRKQPLCEQPRRKSTSTAPSLLKPSLVPYNARRIEIPPPYILQSPGEIKTEPNNNTSKSSPEPSSLNTSNSTDETDKSTNSSVISEEPSIEEVKKKGKAKLARRVSFDPLALLLDASLEGELELVKKTATQVTNPSAANDEGITALHNAICAGHFEIVKFLVGFGCDVNAQDSDGWTPLHCAASCNNLAMVKFLVENGACLFAATLSDHETPAEKCEEDEEGFDGCSEYLYSIQEKLGILNNGEVYAVFSYEAQQNDELSFTINDKLTILRKGDDAEREWWWAKNLNNVEGYVPRNLLGLYPRVPLQITSSND